MVKIAFFIGSLVSGGKERRFVELLTYLMKSGKYEILVITTSSEMHFPQFLALGVNFKQIKKRKPFSFFHVTLELLDTIRAFDADIIHTWGRIQTLYSLPAKVFLSVPLVNGQITNASYKRNFFEHFVDFLNFRFSDVIVSNSFAGLTAYSPPSTKAKVIQNGMNMNRFENLPEKEQIKKKYGIITPFAVVMVATFSENKDYWRFLDVAQELMELRKDVSFLAVGTFHKDRSSYYYSFQKKIAQFPRFIMTGVIHDVEALVNSCDVGILFSNTQVHGEGISNSILEYMALGKPVMANDSGGTKEILQHGINGYLATNEPPKALAEVLNEWFHKTELRETMGKNGQDLVYTSYSLEKMGESFTNLYQKLRKKMPTKSD